MAFVDVYDALTSARPYKQAFTHEKAVEIIEMDVGRKFDPVIARILIENQEEFRAALR